MSTKSIMDTSLTGRRRNRSWPEALKREIVEAALAPGASVSVVARRYDVNANLVFGWRKRYREGSLASVDAMAPLMMVPVTVGDEPGAMLCARTRSFSSVLQRRRRSGPLRTSPRSSGALV